MMTTSMLSLLQPLQLYTHLASTTPSRVVLSTTLLTHPLLTPILSLSPRQHHHITCGARHHIWIAVPVATHPGAKLKQAVCQWQTRLSDVCERCVDTPSYIYRIIIHSCNDRGSDAGWRAGVDASIYTQVKRETSKGVPD